MAAVAQHSMASDLFLSVMGARGPTIIAATSFQGVCFVQGQNTKRVSGPSTARMPG